MKQKAFISSWFAWIAIAFMVGVSMHPVQTVAQTNSPDAISNSPTGSGYLIICNNKVNDDGTFAKPCGFDDVINLAIRIINLAVYIVIPLAALSISFAGFKVLTAGGNAGKVSEAKKIFEKVAIGLFWIVAGWLVIHTILIALLGSNADKYSILKNS